jgi:CHRD domain-containing protein
MKYPASLFAATIVWATTLAVSEAGQLNLQLTGATETPAVTTKASGLATLNVDETGVLSGGIKTTGMAGTAAHIHMGDRGASGPPIITLERAGKDQWMVPQGAKLSVEQLAAYMKGKLYVNVHSKAHPAGEIRAQLEAPAKP